MSGHSEDSIFVQIASYRDRECQWTVKDLFDKARNPERISVGVFWQVVPEEDEDCFVEPPPYPGQVRSRQVHARDCLGLGWARHQALALRRDETFVLQIDSHMRFVEGWDEKLLYHYRQCPNPKSVITVYPPRYTPPNDIAFDDPIRVQTLDRFTGIGILRFSGREVEPQLQNGRPYPTAGLAGGFCFGPAAMVEEVPTDPKIFFCGEEISWAVRLFTHGYDLYSPPEHIVFHYYIREDGRRPWEDSQDWHERYHRSVTRVRQLLEPARAADFGPVQDLGPYGLGSERSLADYEKFSGVSFAGRNVAHYAKRFPFVFSETMANPLETGTAPKVSPQARLFLIEDQGLVFSETTRAVTALNTAAACVWCWLEDGLEAPALVANLAERMEVGQDEARAHLISLLSHWQSLGLLAGSETEAKDDGLRPDDRNTPEASLTPIALPDPEHRRPARHFTLAGEVVAVRCQTMEQEESLARAFGPLFAAAEGPADREAVLACKGERHAIFWDGERLEDVPNPAALAALLAYALTCHYGNDDRLFMTFRGTAVQQGAACTLFPNGDTACPSAIALLLARDGGRICAGEFAGLTKDGLELLPFPLPVALEAREKFLLDRACPGLPLVGDARHLNGCPIHLAVPDAAQLAAVEPLPVTRIVFSRYEPGAETHLAPLGKAEALHGLFGQAFAPPKDGSASQIAAMVRWIEDVDCRLLTFGDLADAVAGLRA